MIATRRSSGHRGHRRWTSPTIVALLILAGTSLSARPVSAFSEVTCSGDGPIEEARVAVGGVAQVWGSYTDWADPGTVTAVFEGPGSRRREAIAGNSADGTYWILERFTAADVGPWTATVTFSETAGDVVCTDAFVVVGATPDTATEPSRSTVDPAAGHLPVALVGLTVLIAIGLALLPRRHAIERRHRR